MIGIDEVGRGSWAGPLLVVSARTQSNLPLGLNDSKLLTKQKRENFARQLLLMCNFGEGWVQPSEIDNLGISNAMRLGVKRALAAIGAKTTDEIVIDGNINYCPKAFINTKAVIKADKNVPVVSAASIYAKVSRDYYMARISKAYPHYGFESNVGYGTKKHLTALQQFGACKIHRLSYKPIKAFV